MKPIASIFWLAVISVTGVSCAPLPSQVATPFVAARAIPTCQMDSTTFVKTKVFFLDPSFNPQQTSSYQSPSGPSVYNVQPFSSDLIAAYDAAHPYFQKLLCGLDAVFIVRNTCNTNPCTPADVLGYSWGFREHPPQIQKGQPAERFIAISQQLWQGGAPPLLSVYETQRIQYLLQWPPIVPVGLHPPAFSNVVPDTRTMSVLAALAHDFGHVYWWDEFVQPPGGDISPGDPSNCNTAFYSASWQNGPAIPMGRWLNFGDVSDNYHKVDDVNMATLFQGLFSRKFYTVVADLLYAIYSGQLPDNRNVDNGRWASALAAYSTDEDFVETFQLYILMTAPKSPLTNLPITIYRDRKTPVTADVPANVRTKPVLKAKIQCFIVGDAPPLPSP
jgi:hypothetical protein